MTEATATAKRPSCMVAVLGAPASGKGTLCKRLAQTRDFLPMHHVSIGDLLRGMASGPDIGAHVRAGTVMRGDEIVPIVARHVSGLCETDDAASAASGQARPTVVLIDGFPRSADQEQLARPALGSRRSAEFPDLVLYFSCPKPLLKTRYVERGRGDDDAALFEKRYEQHERECPDVLQRYRARGIVVEIDTSGDPEDSYRRLVEILQSDERAGVLRAAAAS